MSAAGRHPLPCADSFVFLTGGDSGMETGLADRIGDFAVAAGAGAAFIDRIDVALLDGDSATAGVQDFSLIRGAGFSAVGQIRAAQDGADTVLQFNLTGPGTADMVIVLANFTASTLTGADFVF